MYKHKTLKGKKDETGYRPWDLQDDVVVIPRVFFLPQISQTEY